MNFVISNSIKVRANASSFAALLLSSCVFLSGCKILKPVEDQTHYYVLSSSTPPASANATNQNLVVGIAPVELPAYLQNSHIAVRRGANEIQYSAGHEWAEQLAKGIQRILATDLEASAPATKVLTSAWVPSEVKTEIHISIQRFELDDTGQATLECQWRVVTPTGQRSGHAASSKKGPSLTANPSQAVSALSATLADLSKDLAAALATL